METLFKLFDAEGSLFHEAICPTDMINEKKMTVGILVDIDGSIFKVEFIQLEMQHKTFGTVNVAHLHQLPN